MGLRMLPTSGPMKTCSPGRDRKGRDVKTKMDMLVDKVHLPHLYLYGELDAFD